VRDEVLGGHDVLTRLLLVLNNSDSLVFGDFFKMQLANVFMVDVQFVSWLADKNVECPTKCNS